MSRPFNMSASVIGILAASTLAQETPIVAPVLTPDMPASLSPSTFEIGALVAVDAGGIHPGDLGPDSLPLSLGKGEFGLGWRQSDVLSAHALLVGNSGDLRIDQMWGTIDKGCGKIDFGKFQLAHGLNLGRLFHDPLLQPSVESKLPGVAATARMGSFAPSAALSSRTLTHTVQEEISDSSTIPRDVDRQVGVVTAALDYAFLGKGLARASTQISSDRRDFVVAATVPVSIVSVDGEIALGDGSERAYDAGFFGGIAVNVLHNVQIAVRDDGMKLDDKWKNYVAGGATWHPIPQTFLIAEWMQRVDESEDGTLSLRLGMNLGWTSGS